MALLNRIGNVKAVWVMLLPHVAAPSDMWLAKWCANFSDETIENAIARSAYKFAGVVNDPEKVHRYTSATLRNSTLTRVGAA